MKIAQRLYEAGHITYMRTDHAVMSNEAILAAQELVRNQYGEQYVSTNAVKKNTKETNVPTNAQEAHECIRPTHIELQHLELHEWSPIERNIYNLIWKRAIQSTMASARGKQCVVKILLDSDEDRFSWKATWKKTDFQGWKILGNSVKYDDEESEDDTTSNWSLATSLTQGTKLSWSGLQATPKRTTPSPRFTEATLIRELEKKGIGRPSTFASLVETLFEKQYIETKTIPGQTIQQTTLHLQPSMWPPTTTLKQCKVGEEKQKLVPTQLGESVLVFCIKEFPHLFDYTFTANMESKLDRVSKGEEGWKTVCETTWNSYKTDYERLSSKQSLPSTSEKVRDFGNGLKAVLSKKGLLLVKEIEKGKAVFAPFPDSSTMQTITPEEANEAFEHHTNGIILGKYEEKPLYKKHGPYGFYVQWDTLKFPYVETDTFESYVKKITERNTSTSNSVKVGAYTFSVGKYGPYMYKTDLKKKIFLSIPSSITPSRLSEADATGLYKQLSEAKKSKNKVDKA
jgi:DNA topoisomerase-1